MRKESSHHWAGLRGWRNSIPRGLHLPFFQPYCKETSWLGKQALADLAWHLARVLGYQHHVLPRLCCQNYTQTGGLGGSGGEGGGEGGKATISVAVQEI